MTIGVALTVLVSAAALSGCAIAGAALDSAETAVRDGGVLQSLCADSVEWVQSEASSPEARKMVIAALTSTRDALGTDPAGLATRAELNKAIEKAREPGTDLSSGLGVLEKACAT